MNVFVCMCVSLHVYRSTCVYVCVYMCGLKPMDLGALGTRVCRQDRKVSSNKVDAEQNQKNLIPPSPLTTKKERNEQRYQMQPALKSQLPSSNLSNGFGFRILKCKRRR